MKLSIPELLRPRKPSPAPVVPTPPTTPTNPTTPSNPSRRPSRPPVAPVEQEPNEFGKTLESLLGNKYRTSKVSEEELYAALIVHQIKQKYGDRDAGDWKTLFNFAMTDKPKNERREASAERAANVVMDNFFGKDSIIIPEAEAKKIKETAFRLAQLDDNKDQLWDKHGGDRDNTVAVTSFARAQALMQRRLDAEDKASTSSVRRASRKKAKTLSEVG
jgi:hypothetical protein